MNDKVDITTIAKIAKTSTASVSNYINCTEKFPLSMEKRGKIKDAMRQANYRPCVASSKLRRKGVISSKAVFIFGSFPSCSQYITYRNPMLTELLYLLHEKIKADFGLVMEVRSVEDEAGVESWNDTIADAEVLVCYGQIDHYLLELSVRRNIPLVVISESDGIVSSSDSEDLEIQDVVFWDPGKHLSLMLDHVVSKGATNIGFVTSSNIRANRPEYYAYEAEQKIEAFRLYMSQNKRLCGSVLETPAPDRIIHIDYESWTAFEYARNVNLRAFDAIICHNDMVGLGVAWALSEQGLVAGKDVLLGGEGDYTCCRYVRPQISTVSYDKVVMVKEVCRIIAKKMKYNMPQGERVSVPSKLFEKESTAFFPKHGDHA